MLPAMTSPVAAFRRARQRGLTLIEAAMVLALATIVVAGVLLFFQSASTSNSTNAAASQLAAVQNAVRSLYAGQSSYAGLDATTLIQSRSLPGNMVNGSTITSAFKAGVTVAPVASAGNAQFAVTFDGVPTEACSKMATLELGSSLVSVSVNGTTYTTPTRPTPGQATANCNASAQAQIVWVFL